MSCFTLENFFRPADRPGWGPLSLGIALRRPPSVPRDRRGRRTARCCAARRDGSGDRAARPGPPGEGAAKRCDPPRDAASLRRLPPADVLEEGLHKMAEIAQALADLAVTDRSMIWNTDLVEALELDNPIGQAAVVLHSTLDRTESRCARSREDHPKRDDENWLKHTLAGRDDADRVRLGDRPVRLHPLSNAAFQPSQARLLMRP